MLRLGLIVTTNVTINVLSDQRNFSQKIGMPLVDIPLQYDTHLINNCCLEPPEWRSDLRHCITVLKGFTTDLGSFLGCATNGNGRIATTGYGTIHKKSHRMAHNWP
jgi:hypothetical protein